MNPTGKFLLGKMCIVAVDAPSGSTDISLSSPHDDVERRSGKEKRQNAADERNLSSPHDDVERSSGKEKRQNAADERKEKSRDAARERRAKEFEYFQASIFHNKSFKNFKRIRA